MRHNNPFGFVDLDEHSYLFPPNVIIKAADITANMIQEANDLWAAGKTRKVRYTTTAGVSYYYELVPYIHPAVAAITLASLAFSASNVATETILVEGRTLNEAGAQIAASEEAIDVAGMLFSDYYYQLSDGLDLTQSQRALTLNDGDLCWLIRRGRVFLDLTAAATIGDDLMSSATVAGEMETSTAIDTATGTPAAYHPTLLKHLTGDAYPSKGCCLAHAVATTIGAGLCEADLLLPYRYKRTN